MNDLYKQKREILKKKREFRKKILGVDESDNSRQRVYGEATKTRKALKIQMFGDKTKKSGTKGDDTKIEKFIFDFLNQHDIKFVPQKAIRYLNYDAWLPECNLYIEVNGEYFHCDERIYTKGPKNKLQRLGIEKTNKKREVAQSKNVNLLEIWGPDIEQCGEIVKEQLLKLIAQLKEEKEQKYRFFTSMDWTREVFDPKGF